MTFLEVFEKYNLTEKDIHYLQVMKDRNLDKNWIEAGFDFDKWKRLIVDGILTVKSYNSLGLKNCIVANFIDE